MVYKIFLKKELEFYNIYFSYATNLVTDIQDVQYNYANQSLIRNIVNH